MEGNDTLESTNRVLHDLERKLSFALTTSLNQTSYSHGSVIQNPAMAGLASHNIQLSVLQYIRNNDLQFDADLVYAERQLKLITKFAREYSPSTVQHARPNPQALPSALALADVPLEFDDRYSLEETDVSPYQPLASLATDRLAKLHEPLARLHDVATKGTVSLGVPTGDTNVDTASMKASIDDEADYDSDAYDDYYDGEFDSGDDDYGEDDFETDFNTFEAEPYDLNDDHEVDDDEVEDEDLLLPPLPPRLPPREMDPDKLYGLYDFSGPDPLHCTLSRDEPVYLINDLDNYWWLIRKMSKTERMELWDSRGSKEDIASDDEDGKIGFVPAECLETYGERLARLNCFKNEELEKTSRETLPLEYYTEGHGLTTSQVDFANDRTLSKEEILSEGSNAYSVKQLGEPIALLNDQLSKPIEACSLTEIAISSDGLPLVRKSSILKKTRGYKQSNKLVTFENLGDISLDDNESDDIDFSDHYFHIGHEDIKQRLAEQLGEHDVHEKHSEVLSDVYPAEMPLRVSKTTRKSFGTTNDDPLLVRPRALGEADVDSIGSYSPDTPQPNTFASPHDLSPSNIRRSQILDKLSQVTSDIQDQLGAGEKGNELFGGSLRSGSSEDDEDGSGNFARASSSPSHEDDEDDFYGNGYELACDEEQKDGGDNDTPLTSMNSLNLSASPKTPVQDKRKSKPVHDMFMPILGKLDELTEKLAELEQHLL